MIQRIQSLWFLVAVLFMALMFYFPIYKSDQGPLGIGNNFIAIILVVLSMALSLFSLFSFKDRKKQNSLTWLNLLLCVALQAWTFVMINKFTDEGLAVQPKGHYWIGAFLPLATIIFLFMARAGVQKDEKLVKSLDRLR